MSCWVVPIIAADFLNVSLEQIQARIDAGTIPTNVENGFTFVDVLPEMENLNLPLPQRPLTPPPTFTVVSRAEMAALTAPFDEAADLPSDMAVSADSDLEGNAHRGEAHREDVDDAEAFSWRIARASAALRRRAPRQAA